MSITNFVNHEHKITRIAGYWDNRTMRNIVTDIAKITGKLIFDRVSNPKPIDDYVALFNAIDKAKDKIKNGKMTQQQGEQLDKILDNMKADYQEQMFEAILIRKILNRPKIHCPTLSIQ